VLQPAPFRWGNLQTITWDRTSGVVEAAADPRGEGAGLVQ
jgi:gamma-glutamyltranspeptidase